MRKAIIIILTIGMFTSCSDLQSSINRQRTEEKLKDVKYALFEDYDFSNLRNINMIARWVSFRVKPSDDITRGFKDEYSSPENTLNRGCGDCEDFAFLVMNIAQIALGIKMDMVVQDTTGNGKINHVDIMYNGVVYSAQIGEISIFQEISDIYTFDEVFN